MPDKINIIFGYTNFQELKNRIQELIAGYAQMLKQPVKKEDKLLIEDVPKIGIKPKSIGDNKPTQEEKERRNAIGPTVGPIWEQVPQRIKNGSKL